MILTAILVGTASLLGWHYAGYPLVLAGLAKWCGSNVSPGFESDDELPPVSIIIIAHNEADTILERIENCLDVDYPTEKLEVVVASDGSTDDTVELAQSASGPVEVFDNPSGSKSETRNIAVERASHDIILFTDAETRYEPSCVRRLVNRFADPDVGGVCGTLVTGSFSDGAIGKGMSIYWRWEYFMRSLQGRLGTLVKMSGANMGMRRSFYREVPDTMDIDQVAGLDVIRQGGRSLHAGDAVAREKFKTNPKNELQVRRRLTIRALSALRYHYGVFNPVRYPFLSVHTSSYWLLRYLVPFLLLAVLAASAVLATSAALYWPILGAQVLFYGLAMVGYLVPAARKATPVSVPFSYCWANIGIGLGVVAFLAGQRLESY